MAKNSFVEEVTLRIQPPPPTQRCHTEKIDVKIENYKKKRTTPPAASILHANLLDS